MRPKRVLTYLWTAPTTALGLPFLIASPFSTFAGVALHTGVIEIWGGLARWFLIRAVPLPGGASAMTLGHIVIARDRHTLDRTRTHERVHVRQAERWGPLFVPAYLGCSLWLRLRGKDPYLDNPFEIEAYAKG